MNTTQNSLETHWQRASECCRPALLRLPTVRGVAEC